MEENKPQDPPAVKRARQDAIRRIIQSQSVGTQAELARLLGQEGIGVTQATLSRDLAQLGGVRVHRPNGTCYELPPPLSGLEIDRERLREIDLLVLGLGDNDALVVVRTRPGTAAAVALAIDAAQLSESLGTLAGDDTVFVTPQRGTSTRTLGDRLREVLALGDRQAGEGR
jgi:transcriptional regulator of arginine metabolism